MKYTCASCQKHSCHQNELEKAPKNCPTLLQKEELDQITQLYQDKENYQIAQASSKIVMNQYGSKTRVREIIDFCKEMNYYHIGLGLCVGHDTLFFKYSLVPVTVLAVKDCVFAVDDEE